MCVLKKARFLLSLLLCFAAIDTALARVCPGVFEDGWFELNDYEITRRDHPEQVWERVFYGGSAVTAAYREELGESGYVNLGLSGGTVSGLWEMLRQGEVEVGGELVLGLDWLTLYDGAQSDPSYPWNRGALEPYCYFQRERLYTLAREAVKSTIGRASRPQYAGQGKAVCRGSLSGGELDGLAAQLREDCTGLTLDDCSVNLEALEDIAEFCAQRGIRLRAVRMPWNPGVERPELVDEALAQAEEILAACGVEVLDLSGAFDESCFYDAGRLNYEYGAYRFMEVIEPWLLS